jgi:hypothetical protein
MSDTSDYKLLIESMRDLSAAQVRIGQGLVNVSTSAEISADYYSAKLAHAGEVSARLALQFGLVFEVIGKLADATGFDLDGALNDSPYLKSLNDRTPYIEQLSQRVTAAEARAKEFAGQFQDGAPQAPAPEAPVAAPSRRRHFTSAKIKEQDPVERELDSLLSEALSGMAQN